MWGPGRVCEGRKNYVNADKIDPGEGEKVMIQQREIDYVQKYGCMIWFLASGYKGFMDV